MYSLTVPYRFRLEAWTDRWPASVGGGRGRWQVYRLACKFNSNDSHSDSATTFVVYCQLSIFPCSRSFFLYIYILLLKRLIRKGGVWGIMLYSLAVPVKRREMMMMMIIKPCPTNRCHLSLEIFVFWMAKRVRERV
jgi:hypothetical protein